MGGLCIRTAFRAAVVVVCVCASAGLGASSAEATLIKVDTTAETAVFDPPGPVYTSLVVGDNGPTTVPGRCSLREAVDAANTHTAVNGCPQGTGDDTIELMPGTYHMEDNLFIQEKMTILGPNAGLAGTDPRRHPEAILELDYNPGYAAQPPILYLDQGSPTGEPLGAGTVINGIELRGGFTPSCSFTGNCEISAVDEPAKSGAAGFTLTDSIVRDFTYGLYLGGVHDVITYNLFEDDDRDVAGSYNQGNDIYADYVHTVIDPEIAHNVFANPATSAINLQGDIARGTAGGDCTPSCPVTGGVIAYNAIGKAPVNSGAGIYALGIQGLTIENNLITNPKPVALASRADAGLRLDRIDGLQISGNTITGFGGAIGLGDAYFGTPGVLNVTLADNRIYNNLFGIRVRPLVFGTTQYGPLAINANDNWWGANDGPGSTGTRPGAANPVNGVTFLDVNDKPVADQGGITTDRWLHLTCRVPGPVQVNVPAAVTGQVLGMPTVESSKATPPWFINQNEPLMEASAPGVGNVYGFGGVPNHGPNNAELTGALLATSIGSGNVFVEMDSERVACPVTVAAGPDPVIGKYPDSPTATAGGLIGFRITAQNRGRVAGRHLGVCDLPPRRFVFVRANRRIKRFGKRLCLTIPRLKPGARVSLHLTFRVADNAPGGAIVNGAEVTPGPPSSKRLSVDNVAIERAKAKLVIRPIRRLHPPPPPAVTG